VVQIRACNNGGFLRDFHRTSAPQTTAGLAPLCWWLRCTVRLVGDKRSRRRTPRAAGVRFRFALAHPGGSVQMRLGHRVSPPWFGFALATATGFCALISVPIARSRPKPRLAYASRSSVGRANADVEMRFPSASALRFAVVAYANRSWCTTGVRCHSWPGQSLATACISKGWLREPWKPTGGG
jgi:hypothetical protein